MSVKQCCQNVENLVGKWVYPCRPLLPLHGPDRQIRITGVCTTADSEKHVSYEEEDGISGFPDSFSKARPVSGSESGQKWLENQCDGNRECLATVHSIFSRCVGGTITTVTEHNPKASLKASVANTSECQKLVETLMSMPKKTFIFPGNRQG